MVNIMYGICKKQLSGLKIGRYYRFDIDNYRCLIRNKCNEILASISTEKVNEYFDVLMNKENLINLIQDNLNIENENIIIYKEYDKKYESICFKY